MVSQSTKTTISTQESLQEVIPSTQRFSIGVTKEDKQTETRVPLTPQGVAMLVDAGHRVMLESGVGEEANFTDLDYAEYGGEMVSRTEALRQDIVLMIAPPSVQDIEGIKKGGLLMSLMRLKGMCRSRLEAMHAKQLTAVALDWIEDEYGEHTIANSMKEIEGNAAIVMAANMSAYTKGKGTMIGSIAGVSPSEILILGAGMAGQSAARCAIGMGATVKFFDSSLQSLQKVRSLFGHHIVTSILHPTALAKASKTADVIIGALEDTDIPYTIHSDFVKDLKKNTLIIDLNIDKGGTCEYSKQTSLKHPVYTHNNVHYCALPALSAIYPRTASIALSNIISPLLLNINNYENRGQYICSEMGIQSGIYMYNGILSCFKMGRQFNLSAKDLQLLLTVF